MKAEDKPMKDESDKDDDVVNSGSEDSAQLFWSCRDKLHKR